MNFQKGGQFKTKPIMADFYFKKLFDMRTIGFSSANEDEENGHILVHDELLSDGFRAFHSSSATLLTSMKKCGELLPLSWSKLNAIRWVSFKSPQTQTISIYMDYIFPTKSADILLSTQKIQGCRSLRDAAIMIMSILVTAIVQVYH